MSSFTISDAARRTYAHLREDTTTATFIARHPRELAHLPRWLRENRAATITLRSPWWPYSAIEWVGNALPPRPRVFEFGGGGSTLWLIDRGATVTVAEHDAQWHEHLAGTLPPDSTLLFRPPTQTGTVTSPIVSGYFDSYVAAIDDQPDDSFDLVIVDGRARVECVRRAVPKVKPGGILVLDDADRPRYRPAVQALAGWERRAFRGLKPGQRFPADTCAWLRPA